jgi:hypothetical protein
MKDEWKRNFRSVTFRLSDGTTVTGKLNIGEYAVVSDFLKHSRHNFWFYQTQNPVAARVTLLSLTEMRLHALK